MNFRTYKYKLKPNTKQKATLDKNIDGCYFFRNLLLENADEGVTLFGLNHEIINYYVDKYDCLKEVNKNALSNEITILKNQKRSKYVHRVANSFTINQTRFGKLIDVLYDDKVLINEIGAIKKSNNRHIDKTNSIWSFTFQKIENNYYLLVNLSRPSKQSAVLNINNIIAFDYSSTHFLIDENGNEYDVPRFQRDKIKLISDKQANMSKCQKGSNKYNKLKKEIRTIYQKIANSRKDYLHKLSTEIANKYDYVIIETLDMVEMSKSHNLAKATLDNCFSTFVSQLDYKMKERNKKLIKVSRWYPSSKRCHVCHYINHKISLKDRTWICPSCKTILDRDINSAINIKEEGIRIIQTAGQSVADKAETERCAKDS